MDLATKLKEEMKAAICAGLPHTYAFNKTCEWLAEMTTKRYSVDCAEKGLPEFLRQNIQKVGFTLGNRESIALDDKSAWIVV
jgi:hypothetical protein